MPHLSLRILLISLIITTTTPIIAQNDIGFREVEFYETSGSIFKDKVVDHLMIGRKAPDIVGKDMYGNTFRLNDYKGKIVILIFTGHWCGPCRGEYPFQRYQG
ncbi:peroxiredoxin family protein [Bacteroidota bacterium]